ncbi:hypothetical protein [Lancefieldella parvula]|uniref:hypothetical protein n=1 Tax=Lancefieldella parvula TaxID=1382 RepID=UPI00288A6CCF|nr:hypothetical protein [Lancefieldella parvula]
MKKRIILVALLPLLVYFTADCLGIFEPHNVAYLMAFRYAIAAYGLVGALAAWFKDKEKEACNVN